ncbi:required for excision 1-B domain-containing protein-like isoform X2 [Anneissia japonica]|uniref:required for excision 1-B domain-containing protein-like isoform X2 n=1 Tax=Anneissia japonica TaxID=1529436 RepID=UPI0014255C75|nr:required for excision 1-B domain-containing protein-like isoform X2 [Anneissia japonica]
METEEAVSEPRRLVCEFYKLQEQRVATYKTLDNAHIAYLQTAPDYDFLNYRQKVHDVTEAFNHISQSVISIEQKLRNEHGKTAVADCIAQVQEMEKKHLEMIAELQLAKQNTQDLPGDEDVRELMVFIKQRLNNLLQELAEHLENLKYETEGL